MQKTKKQRLVKLLSCFIPSAKLRKSFRTQYISKRFYGNRIFIIENGIERRLNKTENFPGIDINFEGNNNIVKLYPPLISRNCFINICNDNCVIEIQDSWSLCNLRIDCWGGDGQRLLIKRNTTVVEANIILEENAYCEIGEDCMLSNKILIRSSDGHSVIDAKTGKVVNETAEKIIIGNHVWIGTEAMILKNSQISSNSIVAAKSIVNKKFIEENVIIAGIPAKVVKKGISWRRENPWILSKIFR